MSDNIEPVVFEVLASINAALENMAKVQTAIEETAAKVTEENAKIKESSHEAGLGFKEMAEAAGAFAAFDFLKDSVQVAADAAGSVQVLNQAIVNAGGSVQKLTPAMDSVREQMMGLGFVSAETSKGMQGMVAMVGEPTKALNLMGLAADVARARHIDLQQAVRLVGMAATGHVQLLARLGIQTKDAAGNTLTAAQAVDMLGKKFGGTAQAYTGSMAGQMEVMKAQMDDAKEKIGTALIPVITKLAPIFAQIATTVANDLIPPIKMLSALYLSHKDLINALVVALIAGYTATKVWSGLIGAYNMVVKTAEAVTFAWTVATKGLTVAQEGENAAMEANPIGLLIGLIAGLVAVLIYAWDHSKTFRDIVVGVWTDIQKAAGDAVAFVINYGLKPLVDAYIWAAKQIVNAADAMLGWVPGFGSMIKDAKAAVQQFGDAADSTLQSWADSASKWGDSVSNSVSKVKEATKGGGEGGKFNISSDYGAGLSNVDPNAAKKAAAAAKKAQEEAAKAAKKAAEERKKEAEKHHKEQEAAAKKAAAERKKEAEKLRKEQEAEIKAQHQKILEEQKQHEKDLAAEKKAAAEQAKKDLQHQLDETRLQLQEARAALIADKVHDETFVNGAFANVGTSLLNMGYAAPPPPVTVIVQGSVTTQQQLVGAVQQGILQTQRTNGAFGLKTS